MSHLQKLSIQGVRSFNPDEAQEIKFFPLTMILGPNGAGKTTIIETLKYATTGNLPPNCNGGKSFVHDVQFANQPIIRGQVRLRFTDAEQKSTTITRSMQTSVRNSKNSKPSVTFKQINSVIKRGDTSIDQKCADINTELLELIGVSKAVLNNVIFCHQEDTNWPLSEGKALKEKFDDIFGSIGYVKALEKIKKTREEEVKTLKLLEKDVTIFSNLKREADNKRKYLNIEQDKLDSEQMKCNELKLKIKEVSEKLEDLIEKDTSAVELMSIISQIEASITEKEKLANGIKKNCSAKTLAKSKEVVEEEVANFDSNSSALIKEKEQFEERSKIVEDDYYRLINDKQKISNDLAKISECKNQIRKCTSERDSLIRKLESKEAEFQAIVDKIEANSELTKSDCQLIIQLYKTHLAEIQTLCSQKKSTIQSRQFDLKQKLDSLKSEKSNASHEKDIWQKQLRKLETETAQLTKLLSQSSVSETKLKELTDKIAHYQGQLSKYDNSNDATIKRNISNLESTKLDLKRQIERLEQEISTANSDNEEKIRFDILSAQKKEKESKVNEIKAKHSELFWKVNADEGCFYVKLTDHISKISQQYDESTAKASSLEKEHCVKKSKLDSQQNLLGKSTKELASLKSRFDGLCDIDRFEIFLQNKEQELNDLRTEKSSLANMAPVIDCQIATITKHEMCPVCESDLSLSWISKKTSTNVDRQELIAILEKAKGDNPNELKQINARIKEAEQTFNKLLLLKSDFRAIQTITKEIPLIKNELSQLKEQTEDVQKLIDKEKVNLNYTKEKIDSRRKCLQDANDFDNSCKELKEIKRKLDQFDSNKWSEAVDIEDLNLKLKTKQNDFQSTDDQLSELQKDMLKASEEKMKLQNLLQAAERSKLDFEKREHEKIANINKRQELNSQLDELKEKVEGLDEKALELNPKIEKLEADLRAVEKELKMIEKESQQKMYQCQDSMNKLDNLFAEIEKYSEQLKESKLKTSQEYIDQLDSDISNLENEKKTLSEKINKLSHDIANLEVQKRELFDYQTYLNLKEDIITNQVNLKESRSKMGFMDLASIKRSRITAEKELTGLETKSKVGLERIREIDDRIGILNSELSEPQYASAESKYKSKLVDKTISELTCEDLNKYYKALDYSISSFHKCKMEEINKLLKKFWQIAYQGKDIDYIKVLSDEEERSASDKRRTYNYRVVMVRGNKEMDMKGRCSAGQKVLASLVIRLALAVIFCRNFAVLTLDEPTTNLDKANIRSFARAVISLIKSNRNFQILIITHDEEFLECLDSDISEFYYKVFKNDEGYSTIIQKSINQDTNIFTPQRPLDGNSNGDTQEEEDEINLELAPKRPKLDNKPTADANNFFSLSQFDEGVGN